MLKYVTAQHSDEEDPNGPNPGKRKLPLSRLDQEESPARALLQRITNSALKQV